jgi:hypothetical protein
MMSTRWVVPRLVPVTDRRRVRAAGGEGGGEDINLKHDKIAEATCVSAEETFAKCVFQDIAARDECEEDKW